MEHPRQKFSKYPPRDFLESRQVLCENEKFNLRHPKAGFKMSESEKGERHTELGHTTCKNRKTKQSVFVLKWKKSKNIENQIMSHMMYKTVECEK